MSCVFHEPCPSAKWSHGVVWLVKHKGKMWLNLKKSYVLCTFQESTTSFRIQERQKWKYKHLYQILMLKHNLSTDNFQVFLLHVKRFLHCRILNFPIVLAFTVYLNLLHSFCKWCQKPVATSHHLILGLPITPFFHITLHGIKSYLFFLNKQNTGTHSIQD